MGKSDRKCFNNFLKEKGLCVCGVGRWMDGLESIYKYSFINM